MEQRAVSIDKPGDLNLILGQAHFIKAGEDIHEAGGRQPNRSGVAFWRLRGHA